MLLEIKDMQVHYGNVAALKGISIEVGEGDFVTLIGSNGAGKSTTLRAISGLDHPSAGIIVFDGKRIEKMSPDKILKLGIAHAPEGRRIFKDLSVMENLLLGAFVRDDQEEIKKDLEAIFIHFPRLRERKDQSARTMSGGEQQMIAIGRALMSRPKLLLLDEPSLGLAPVIVQEISRILVDINKQGVSIVLVEQNAELALELAQHGYVLETGTIALDGKAKSLMDNDHVRKAYLGI
ncbi:MAG: ABC transporter ATP-binding protein [Deltaproteobacteria bacterium]|jgi:branched-chain amino acid transport system ATP-binding protein|nr:ABC transporter ATP-binding protein [Deltaproteobacteria bacterium]MBT4873761.1 ABC transporter ATP-binding protein [Desulfobacula sp.]MBT4267544.1 ABC transporter ATP-binding protein [Deltaproteobacteria bacterium]MBT4642762.1 ABC transporter ATP-binding protein [Deltaproteobacteria bacterium]MBT6613694.1 ABC transporter ATP-binding protein [Deltaproteobacteria bacterium]